MVDANLTLAGYVGIMTVFDELPVNMQIKILKPAVKVAVDSLAESIQRFVPVRSGTLRTSIGSSVVLSNKKGSVTGKAGADKSAGAAGRAKGACYAHLVNNPHRKRGGGMTRGAYFMQRGEEAGSKTATDEMEETILQSIEVFATKLAKKSGKSTDKLYRSIKSKKGNITSLFKQLNK